MATKKNGGATPPEEEPQDTVDNGETKKTPLASFSFPGSPGSTIECAIWENEVTLSTGETVLGHAATFSRSFKQGNSWRRTSSYRLNDLLVLQYAIGRAIDHLMEARMRQS